MMLPTHSHSTQLCRMAARMSPPKNMLKRTFDASRIGNHTPAGPGGSLPFGKRLRMGEEQQSFVCRENYRGNEENQHRGHHRPNEYEIEEDYERRQRKAQDRTAKMRDAARPSVFDQADSTALNRVETDAEIADKYIPLKKRRMHEHRMDGAVATSVKEKNAKEVTFTFAQVRSILAKALKEKEVDLRLEFEAILQEKLMEQYQQFIKFNEDYVSRTSARSDDSASWFYVS